MALAVVISPNGIPVSSAPSPYGFPVILATNGFGVPVTPVASGGRAVFDVGGNLFDSGSSVGPNYRMRAQAGSFVFTGESMTIQTGYAMTAQAGAFALAGQSATLTPPVAATFTFDPANKGSFADLLNGNRDLHGNNSAPGWESARAIAGTSSAKQYVEFKLVLLSSPQIMIGLCDTTFTVTTDDTYMGKNGHSVGFYFAGSPFSGSMTIANSLTGMGTIVVNDIIMMALDATAGNLWIGLNNVWGSGNPSTGTAPWVTFTPGPTWYFAATCHIGAGTPSLTATMAYAPPTGFTGVNS